MILSAVICFLILIEPKHSLASSQKWGWILLVVLVGVILPRYYLSTLKSYRITFTDQEFLLEQLPAKVVNRQPMSTLIRWGVVIAPNHREIGKCLHFDFKHSGRVRLQSSEYREFDKLVVYMEKYYPRKKWSQT